MIRIDEPHPGSMARRRHSIPPAPRPPLGWNQFRHVIIARSHGCFTPPWHDDVRELQAMASAPHRPRGEDSGPRWQRLTLPRPGLLRSGRGWSEKSADNSAYKSMGLESQTMLAPSEPCTRCGRPSPIEDSPELDGGRFVLCQECAAIGPRCRPVALDGPPSRPCAERSMRRTRRPVVACVKTNP